MPAYIKYIVIGICLLIGIYSTVNLIRFQSMMRKGIEPGKSIEPMVKRYMRNMTIIMLLLIIMTAVVIIYRMKH